MAIGGRKVSRTGYPGPDVEGADGTVYEVKRLRTLPVLLAGWLTQAKTEGADAVAFRADHGEWYVVCPLHYWQTAISLERDDLDLLD